MALFSAGESRKSHKSRKLSSSEPGIPESSAAASGRPSTVALAVQSPLTPTSEAESTTLPQEDPKKQWWKRPKDSKTRKLVEKIMVMRAAGHEDKAIAKKLQSTEGAVRQYVYVARKNGWLNDEDEPIDLELELALSVDRKIVRNVSAALDGQMTNWQTHEMTIAAAKGRGVFKNHEVSKNEGGSVAMPLVAIQVIMPPVGTGDQLPHVAEDQMGGRAAYAETVDGEIDNGAAETA